MTVFSNLKIKFTFNTKGLKIIFHLREIKNLHQQLRFLCPLAFDLDPGLLQEVWPNDFVLVGQHCKIPPQVLNGHRCCCCCL